MSDSMQVINIIRGDDTTLSFIVNIGGTPIDVEGYEAWFTMREELPEDDLDTDVLANGAIIAKHYTVPAGGEIGEISFDLTNVDTKIKPIKYYADVQTFDTNEKIASSEKFYVNVESDITQSIPEA